MSLELAIAENTRALNQLISILRDQASNPVPENSAEYTPGFGAAVNDAAKTVVAETKAKRTKKEAAPEAPAGEPVEEATAPSPEAGATDAPATEDAAAPTEPPTYADAAAAVTRVVKELGTPRAKELLAMFGAGNLKEVAPERYAAVIAAAEVVLTGVDINL
jgi:hypothetical protein